MGGTHRAEQGDREEFRYTGEINGTTVLDASGSGNDGMILTAGGGQLVTANDAGIDGAFLRFPPEPCGAAPCPRAVVKPTRPDALAPGDDGQGSFAFGAKLRLRLPAPQDAGMNIMQRGFAQAGTSQWKLQVDRGQPQCRWSDGNGVVLLPEQGTAPFTLQVDTWYDSTCSRLPDGSFELRVSDARGAPVAPVQRAVSALGSILPSGDVVIGSKTRSVAQPAIDAQTDQLHGDLDDVFFRSGEPGQD